MTDKDLDKYLVVVIAPDRPCEKKLLRKTDWDENNNSVWSFVVVHGEGNTNRDKELNDKCIFILINQCQKECEIEKLLKNVQSLKKKIIVWTHQTTENGFNPFSCECIKKILGEKLFDCQNISHPTFDFPDKGAFAFLGFMNSFANDNNTWENRKAILQSSIAEVVKKKSDSDAHSLRSEILTPFIPFHLFHQLDNKESFSTDKEWQNIFKECCSVINNTDTENNIEKKFNKLIELKKDIPLDFKDCSTGRFKELKEIFQKSENDCVKNTEKKNCLKIIEEFAQCLEKIVNCIESGEKN